MSTAEVTKRIDGREPVNAALLKGLVEAHREWREAEALVAALRPVFAAQTETEDRLRRRVLTIANAVESLNGPFDGPWTRGEPPVAHAIVAALADLGLTGVDAGVVFPDGREEVPY